MRLSKGATGSDPVQKGGRIASKSIPGAMLKIFFHPGVRQFHFAFFFGSIFVFFSHGSYRSILMRDEKYRAVYGKDFIALHFRSLATDIAL